MNRRSILAGPAALVIAQAEHGALRASGSADDLVLATPRDKRILITIQRRQIALARSLLREEAVRRGPSGYIVNQASTAFPFSKGIRHTPEYQFDMEVWRRVYQAIDQGDLQGVEAAIGGMGRISNPIAASSLLDCGSDSVQYVLAEPLNIHTDALALDALELCWAALCRDVPFGRYNEDERIGSAVAELSNASKTNISTADLFGPPRGRYFPGPRVSQFLLSKIVLGGINQSFAGVLAQPGIDYITSFPEFLHIQDGFSPLRTLETDPRIRYPYSGRSLATIVYRDYPAQYFMVAAQRLFDMGHSSFNRSHPYARLRSQVPFATFGLPHCFALLNKIACHALTVAWFYKWNVYRYLRPEEYFGLLHVSDTDPLRFTVPLFLRDSEALGNISRITGTYLLPQAYPEGSPIHPSYPAGHAVVAGACGTILKFFFNPNMRLPATVDVTDDGTALIPYEGELEIGDEIDKLIWNISYGRSYAGIHWRMDCEQGIRLGEQIAKDLLSDVALFCAERYEHVQHQTFFGTDMIVESHP